ncbi:FHA domain protein [Maioricimonas rarisocia]|uniref:FHA domain protein n=1 Tax=Maioricimonas rarisocia TaxID=2528026 RepID=A0A517Z2H1_9PLAN|nr:FHA domain-containing protein [Maioricimonas rarisocia]QDU36666.1 FHA domain protein [Maioricimonas rarisocia]
MFGLLIPCGGGKPIVLRRGHILVGRRLEYAPEDGNLPAASGLHCELVYDEQGWTVRTFHGPRGIRVRVNGARVETRRLESGDILFLAGRRYRIEFSRVDQFLPDSDLSLPEARGDADPAAFDVPRGLLIPQGEGRRFPLVKPTIVVGSARDSDLVLPGLTVAPHHCRLDFEDGWWRVTDTSRGLGMRVDHIPVQEHWLYPGDVLTIAMFRYELHYPVGASLTAGVAH